MNQRFRVLHIATRFLSGGSERRVFDLVQALSFEHYDHHLIVGSESDLDRARRLLGDQRVVVEPHLVRSPIPHRDAMALRHMVGSLRTGRFDVIHTCQSKAGIIGRMAARIAGVPVITHSLTMTNFGEGFAFGANVAFREAERRVGRWTDAYFVVGTELRDRFLGAGIASPERYHIVRSTIDVKGFREAALAGSSACRNALALPLRNPIIAFVGALEARKGVLDLVELLSRVRECSGLPVLLAVAGDGPLRSQLERRFDIAGLGNAVQFLGFTQQVPEIMGAANCIVLPSRAEGVPQVLVQAAATGTPFVSYAVDGPSELIQRGSIGSIVPTGNLAAAARAVMHYLEPRDARTFVDLREWERDYVLTKYRTLFAQLLHRHEVSSQLPQGLPRDSDHALPS